MVFHLKCSTDRHINLLLNRGDMTPVNVALQTMIKYTELNNLSISNYLLIEENQTQFNLWG